MRKGINNHFPKETIRKLEWYIRTCTQHIYLTWEKADVRKLRNKKGKIHIQNYQNSIGRSYLISSYIKCKWIKTLQLKAKD